MNKYKISIYNGSSWIDITKYIQTGINISDKLDESLDNASFTIPYIKSNSIEGMDLSKPIPPYTPIKIDIIDNDDNLVETFRMYTSNPRRTIVKKSEPKLYQHEFDLIEATKILQRKVISDMTITQPKGNVFKGAFFSDSKTLNKVTINNTLNVIDLQTQNQSINPGIIEDTVLKAGYEGDVVLTLDVWNEQYNAKWTRLGTMLGLYEHRRFDAEVELKVELLSNGNVIKTDTINIDPASGKRTGTWIVKESYKLDTPYQLRPAFTKHYEIPSSDTDQNIKLRLSTLGKYYYSVEDSSSGGGSDLNTYDDEVQVIPYLTLSAGEVDTPEKFIYLDEAVDKVLRLVDINSPKKYKLDRNTRDKIRDVLCPEFTFTTYTVWDALEKISRVVNAIPTIDNDDYTTISFEFLDDIPDIVYDNSVFNDESLANTMDTYNSSLQINASNVIEEDILKNVKIEPYDGGWMTVRADGDLVETIEDGSAAFKVRQDIYRVYKLLIRGLGVKIKHKTSGDEKVLYGTNNDDYMKADAFDISDRVVESSEWNVLHNRNMNASDVQRLSSRTKGNHVHYQQGTKYIKGLGYQPSEISDIFGSKHVPRALIESVFCSVASYIVNNPDLEGYEIIKPGGWNDNSEIALTTGKHKVFEGVLAQVHYIPIANVRTNIYKHNAWDLGVDLTNFSNEQDMMNDTNNLGRYVGNAINKLGNTEYMVSGQLSDYRNVPKLGYRTNNNLVVTSRDIVLHKNYVDYTLQLSENFINQNSRLAPTSVYRQYQIPQTDSVFRQDIVRQFVVLTEDKYSIPNHDSILSSYGKIKLIQNYCNIPATNNSPLTYGKIKITKEEGSTYTDNVVEFDMPVNGYSIGNTLNLQLQFDSNYSAGPQKIKTTIQTNKDGIEHTYQSYTSYTNKFGNVYSIDLSLYPRGRVNNDETDANQYPMMVQSTSEQSNLNLSLVIDKDAREQYGLNIEIPFISGEPDKIRIYPGMAKYNGLIRNKDSEMEIGIGLLDNGYFPAINQTTLNTEKITVRDNKGSFILDSERGYYGIYFGNIEVPFNRTYEGYVVYEKTTKDIIYAVRRDIPDTSLWSTPTVWFIPTTSLNDRTIPLN